jgi:hypothetical protein
MTNENTLLEFYGNQDSLRYAIENNEEYPFLLDAPLYNQNYGMKLIKQFEKLDTRSKKSIKKLFSYKEEILEESPGILEQNPLAYRQKVEERLLTYKNNQQIMDTMKEKGFNVDSWKNLDRESYFTLGEQEETSFGRQIETPLTRIEETLDHYKTTLKSVMGEFQKELENSTIVVGGSAEDLEKIEKMESAYIQAEKDGDMKKAGGIKNGVENFKKKVFRETSAWLKILGDFSNIEMVVTHIKKVKERVGTLETYLKENPISSLETKEQRSAYMKAKQEISVHKNDTQKNLYILKSRLEDFSLSLASKLEQSLGKPRSEAMVQEIKEQTGESIDHFHSDTRSIASLIEDLEGDSGTLDNRLLKIHLAPRDPDMDLYLGNYTDCCIRIDSEYNGKECVIIDYLTDIGMNIVTITDEQTGKPVVAAWVYVGERKGQPQLVIDNIEANTKYTSSYKKQIKEQLNKYFAGLLQDLGMDASKINQGENNNDITLNVKIKDLCYKMGGYNRNDGYYLEAEPDEE